MGTASVWLLPGFDKSRLVIISEEPTQNEIGK
ncbi:hypothetical protein V512_008320 [Mesotoga sp. Brook.08.105.5.1]|nr:hypothetical protein V512_008320 [Mesotoga sp. Brook.08.105.5.1]